MLDAKHAISCTMNWNLHIRPLLSINICTLIYSIIIIINKILIKVTLNKVITGALYVYVTYNQESLLNNCK